jgi:hypothetical protein
MSDPNSPEIIFYGEASKGFIVKVMIDTLCGSLQRGYFSIDKTGVRLRQADPGCTILYDIDLPRKNFKGFKCSRPLVISVNLKHMQGLLRNVKKKDSIAMFIDKKYPEKFFITIRPEGNRRNTRFETNSIVYQEEKDYKPQESLEGCYGFPMVIEAADFQKIKRLTTIGKMINVVIQKDNYLSFKCDAGIIYDSNLGFGELQNLNNERCTCDEDPEYCECVCDNDDCGEYLCDCYCECDKCNEYLCDCTCESDKKVFSAQYYSHILTTLVKLPGLYTQMQFYAPNIQRFPLKIEVNAGQGGYTFGTIRVFIKDVEQISQEESMKNEEEIIKPVKSKKK